MRGYYVIVRSHVGWEDKIGGNTGGYVVRVWWKSILAN